MPASGSRCSTLATSSLGSSPVSSASLSASWFSLLSLSLRRGGKKKRRPKKNSARAKQNQKRGRWQRGVGPAQVVFEGAVLVLVRARGVHGQSGRGVAEEALCAARTVVHLRAVALSYFPVQTFDWSVQRETDRTERRSLRSDLFHKKTKKRRLTPRRPRTSPSSTFDCVKCS